MVEEIIFGNKGIGRLKSHNVHIRDGRKRIKGCTFCEGRFSEVFEATSKPPRGDGGDDNSAGDDEEFSSPFAFGMSGNPLEGLDKMPKPSVE